MSKKAPTFREEMNCEKIYKSIFYDLSVESPVDKSFREGIQDIPTTIPVNNWFGMPPQSQALWVKVYPNCTQTGMRARGALIPQRGYSGKDGDPRTSEASARRVCQSYAIEIHEGRSSLTFMTSSIGNSPFMESLSPYRSSIAIASSVLLPPKARQSR